MQRPTKQLLKDLLDDSVSQEFRDTLMAKTLRSARQRKHKRHSYWALSVVVLAGCLAFAFREMHGPADSPLKNDLSLLPVPGPLFDPVQMVTTKPNSVAKVVSSDLVPAIKIVHTTESARPKEISDRQLLALLSDKPVALVNRSVHKNELMFLDSKEVRLPVP
jgi:hypothetical protein